MMWQIQIKVEKKPKIKSQTSSWNTWSQAKKYIGINAEDVTIRILDQIRPIYVGLFQYILL